MRGAESKKQPFLPFSIFKQDKRKGPSAFLTFSQQPATADCEGEKPSFSP
jgi:hypothetical protein